MKDKVKWFLKTYDVTFMAILFVPPLIFSIIMSPFFPDPHFGVYVVNYLLGIALIVIGGSFIALGKL